MAVNRALSPIGETTSRTDLVAEAIRSAILDRTLQPGDLLVERQLAEQFGVSKTPVREALIMLGRSGLLAQTRNRGVTVHSLTLDEIRHVYEERFLLEPWALRTIIEAGRSDFVESMDALRKAADFATEGNQAAQAMANRRFHRGLYSACENVLIVDVLDSLQDIIALATVTVLWEKLSSSDVEAAEHQAILNAAVAGDAPLAESLLRQHIEASIKRFRTIVSSSETKSA